MNVVKVFLADRSSDIEVSIETVSEVVQSFIMINDYQAFSLESGNSYFPIQSENLLFNHEFTTLTEIYSGFIPTEVILLIEEATVKSAMGTEHVGYRASLVKINKETSSSLMFTVISSMGPVRLYKDEEYTIRKVKRNFQSFYRLS